MRTDTSLAFLMACIAAILAQAAPAAAATRIAIFAGGCFWCVESDFDHVPGVIGTVSGYTGGASQNPTYDDYLAGGHREAVRIDYDPDRVSYEQLLDVFWHSVDPTDAGGQFCDRGHGYSSAIYALGKDEIGAAQRTKQEVQGTLGRPVVTEILSAAEFWPAEDYHQDYYLKNPIRYKYYRFSCGRDDRIAALWGKAAHRGIEGY